MSVQLTTISNFATYACGPETLISEVLRRIDSSPHLFQIIVDRDGRLLGTVTDGDIRRAMLNGNMLDDVAASAMQTKPTTGLVGDGEGNRSKLTTLGSTRTFLPVLDAEGRVSEILIAASSGDTIRSALVMAGGPGTRLGERTKTTPKPLLTVGGKPILDHVLCSLEDAGVTNVLVSVHYLADQIERFINDRDNVASIEILHEEGRLGTAGAVGLVDESLARESLLIVNGDVITSVDFGALYEYHHRHNFDGTVTVARYDVDIPFGVINQSDDGVFEGIEEKPTISKFIAAGIYYLSPEYRALVPRNRPVEMPELLNMGRQVGLKTGLFPIHEYWTDVGRPDDLDAADRTARNRSSDG